MSASRRIDAEGLRLLIAAIRRRGYEVVGPTLHDGAISYEPIAGIEDLPADWTAEQGPGSYRLKRRSDHALFGYATGPKSLKNFLHPSEIKVFTAERDHGPFRILPNTEPAPHRAFLGIRACELAAMGVQDRVLLNDRFTDDFYRDRRRNCLIVSVHCTEPAQTCFCTSMNTGPRAKAGYDLALTEFPGEFLVEIGSALGEEILNEVPHSNAPPELMERSQAATQEAAERMTRRLPASEVRDLLRNNFEHSEWESVAERCLACGNCTMICPTCFCVNFEDASDVAGNHAERWRQWDSCFTLDFSYIHGGSVRLSTKSRYRQWLTHKLSYWFDQFGTSGCVGCGRCITWCPVGIDITEEVAAFAGLVKEGQE